MPKPPGFQVFNLPGPYDSYIFSIFFIFYCFCVRKNMKMKMSMKMGNESIPIWKRVLFYMNRIICNATIILNISESSNNVNEQMNIQMNKALKHTSGVNQPFWIFRLTSQFPNFHLDHFKQFQFMSGGGLFTLDLNKKKCL